MTDPVRTIVARAAFPAPDSEELLPLYVDGGHDGVAVGAGGGIHVSAGHSVSLGSYFNAFPATYWQAETACARVFLDVWTRGQGTVTVLRSDADGRAEVVDSRVVDGDMRTSFDLPLDDFAVGGAYWFDVAAEGELVLDRAEWSVDGKIRGSATIAMTTFNRPAECLAQLRVLASDPHLAEVVDRLVVVDQGDDLVSAQPGFRAIEERLGARLTIVRQPNLGGSGGFSRGMLEALDAGDSDGVLLVDDDAICEPEAVLRAIRFAAAARDPILVGGGMLHLDARNVLYAQSEQWDDRVGWVRLNRPDAYDHDFARVPFRSAPFFHRRQRSDFNGWWMCLIPLPLLREIGLSMPVFLKGDDVEFALRAREHGVRTVTPPGVALWHLGWGGKAPTRTWEAYFLHRNRLITALLHARSRRPTALVLHSFLGDMKPLLSLQYSAVRLRALALSDVMKGPAELPGWLRTRSGEIRRIWAGYSDAMPVTGMTATAVSASEPHGHLCRAIGLVRTVVRQFLRPVARTVPSVRVPADRLGWWVFTDRDSALVDTSDGRATVWYRRDRQASEQALWRSLRLHLALWWRWPRLASDFRNAAPRLTAAQTWRATFERAATE